MNLIRCAIAVALAGQVLASAFAQGTAAPVRINEASPQWAALTASQQSALRPLQAEWPKLDATRKSKWLLLAPRLAAMPEAERMRLQDRMAEWARMTPAERGRARQNYQALRGLDPGERQAAWDSYQSLPPEKRQELAQRPAPSTRPPAAAGDPKAQAVAGKRNLVSPSAQQQAAVRPATPAMVQARPGATTRLVTRAPAPPVHHQPGLPKIAATNGFVNPATLLPKRGPQGAAAALPTAPAEVHDAAQ